MSFAPPAPGIFTKKLLIFGLVQGALLFGALWYIAGNDRLFRRAVPIEQRLVSHNEPIRKKAQQELLGLDPERKRSIASALITVLEQGDSFARKWAAISLALIGSSAQEAIPSLLQAVSAKEKDVAQAARVALSEIGAPDPLQLPSLLRALQDPREQVRCEAAYSVGKMGSAAQQVVPILIGYVAREENSPVCFEEALANLASGASSVYPPVIDLLSSARPEIRRKAAHILELAGARTPDTIQMLFGLLSKEQDATVRSSIAKALQLNRTPPAEQAAVLATALHSDFLPVRLEAAKAVRLSGQRGSGAVSMILRMMRDEDPVIRRLGLETMRRSGLMTPDLLQKVAKAQRDSDSGVRCRAAEYLIESGAVDRVSIKLMISDLRKDEDTARCAEDVLGLAGLFDKDVLYSMIHLVLEDKDVDVRSRAAHVLMHLGPRAQEAIPALMRAHKDQVPGAAMALKAVRAPMSRSSARKSR